MNGPASVPFSAWDGERVCHLTVAPDGSTYVVPSGAHERLHRIVIGDSSVGARFDGPSGPKVDLALAGWVQLQSDRLVDRVNVDAPDGYDGTDLVREFARMHGAGSLAVALYPSGTVLTGAVSEITLPGNGPRVPAPVSDEE